VDTVEIFPKSTESTGVLSKGEQPVSIQTPTSERSRRTEGLVSQTTDNSFPVGSIPTPGCVVIETDGQSKRPVIPYDRAQVDIEVVGDTETDHAAA
jgi:hypothetical protein